MDPKHSDGRVVQASSNGYLAAHEDLDAPCLSVYLIEGIRNPLEEASEEFPLFIDVPITYLELLEAQSKASVDIPSQITMDELVEGQAADEFCKQVHQSLDMGEYMNFDDNRNTEVLERKK